MAISNQKCEMAAQSVSAATRLSMALAYRNTMSVGEEIVMKAQLSRLIDKYRKRGESGENTMAKKWRLSGVKLSESLKISSK